MRQLQQTVAAGRLKSRDKILERIGRLKGKYPKGTPFVTLTVSKRTKVKLEVRCDKDKFRAALARDGVYLLRSNQAGWSAKEFRETYMQLTVVEHAFRVLKGHLLLRPVWHHYNGRVEMHVFICVLAYALWKTLDHLAKQAGLQTAIRKPDPERPDASPKPRPMTLTWRCCPTASSRRRWGRSGQGTDIPNDGVSGRCGGASDAIPQGSHGAGRSTREIPRPLAQEGEGRCQVKPRLAGDHEEFSIRMAATVGSLWRKKHGPSLTAPW